MPTALVAVGGGTCAAVHKVLEGLQIAAFVTNDELSCATTGKEPIYSTSTEECCSEFLSAKSCEAKVDGFPARDLDLARGALPGRLPQDSGVFSHRAAPTVACVPSRPA
jgi:hypothetical protein